MILIPCIVFYIWSLVIIRRILTKNRIDPNQKVMCSFIVIIILFTIFDLTYVIVNWKIKVLDFKDWGEEVYNINIKVWFGFSLSYTLMKVYICYILVKISVPLVADLQKATSFADHLRKRNRKGGKGSVHMDRK